MSVAQQLKTAVDTDQNRFEVAIDYVDLPELDKISLDGGFFELIAQGVPVETLKIYRVNFAGDPDIFQRCINMLLNSKTLRHIEFNDCLLSIRNKQNLEEVSRRVSSTMATLSIVVNGIPLKKRISFVSNAIMIDNLVPDDVSSAVATTTTSSSTSLALSQESLDPSVSVAPSAISTTTTTSSSTSLALSREPLDSADKPKQGRKNIFSRLKRKGQEVQSQLQVVLFGGGDNKKKEPASVESQSSTELLSAPAPVPPRVSSLSSSK